MPIAQTENLSVKVVSTDLGLSEELSVVPEHLLLALVVEQNVEDEDEDALEGVEQREDHRQPLGAVRKVDEAQDPSQAENA